MEGESPQGDERRRLHEIVDGLPDDELSVARQLLELLAKGRAVPSTALDGVDSDDDEMEDDEDDVGRPSPAPDMIAKLTQLTDEELLNLDDLLETDPAAAKAFWRERFGEELEDDSLTGG